MQTISLYTLAIFLVVSIAACGGETTSHDTHDMHSAGHSDMVMSDTPMPDAVNAGDLTVTATFSKTPSVGVNTLNIMVMHNGKAVDGANVTVDPQMIQHGHGSPVTPKITSLGGGKYDASVTFNMAGRWTLTVDAKNGTMTGSYRFEVDAK